MVVGERNGLERKERRRRWRDDEDSFSISGDWHHDCRICFSWFCLFFSRFHLRFGCLFAFRRHLQLPTLLLGSLRRTPCFMVVVAEHGTGLSFLLFLYFDLRNLYRLSDVGGKDTQMGQLHCTRRIWIRRAHPWNLRPMITPPTNLRMLVPTRGNNSRKGRKNIRRKT